MDLCQRWRPLVLALLLLSSFVAISSGDVESDDGAVDKQSGLLRLAKGDPKFHRS